MSTKDTSQGFKVAYALAFAWQLGFLSIMPLVGFLWLGVRADRFFKTSPLFIIIGITCGIIITFYETYHGLIPLIKKNVHND